MKLYELSQAYQNLLDMQDELDETTFTDTLESIQDEIEHKAENTAKVIRTMEAEAKALKEEEERLANRRRAIENRIQRLKDYLKENLERAGKRKVKGQTFTVFVQDSERVQILDENTIPEQYFVLKRQLSKSAIKEAIANGKQVAGAEIVKNSSVRIR